MKTWNEENERNDDNDENDENDNKIKLMTIMELKQILTMKRFCETDELDDNFYIRRCMKRQSKQQEDALDGVKQTHI